MADYEIERVVSREALRTDSFVPSLRPERFTDYPGQDRVKQNLEIFVAAAKGRNEALDHVLLHGPPGLGKTSLARIVAKELGVAFFQTSGPVIERPGDLAGILTSLEERAILFIDEIHRLSIVVEEILYSAMEDFELDIIVGQGSTSRTIKMPLKPFTLIGATTRLASLSRPLVSRFGIKERFEFYEPEALTQIILRTAQKCNIDIEEPAAYELARRSRGTPRIANRLLRRVRDFAEVDGQDRIQSQSVAKALMAMEIDHEGLDPMDRSLLRTIMEQYDGGPVGIDTLSHTIGEDKSTLEDVYESFLVYRGFIKRGPRGREITPKGRAHVAA
jgi:holliday junction DNA helicase RuvB